jgi:hypothetical protein
MIGTLKIASTSSACAAVGADLEGGQAAADADSLEPVADEHDKPNTCCSSAKFNAFDFMGLCLQSECRVPMSRLRSQ